MLGEFEHTLTHCRQALEIFEADGDLHGVCSTLDSLVLERPPKASVSHAVYNSLLSVKLKTSIVQLRISHLQRSNEPWLCLIE